MHDLYLFTDFPKNFLGTNRTSVSPYVVPVAISGKFQCDRANCKRLTKADNILQKLIYKFTH